MDPSGLAQENGPNAAVTLPAAMASMMSQTGSICDNYDSDGFSATATRTSVAERPTLPESGLEGLSINYIEFTKGSKKFWDSWKKQFASRWEDPEFRDWYSKAMSSDAEYAVGPEGTHGSGDVEAEPTLPRTTPRYGDGSSSVQRGQAVKDSHQAGETKLTHYGYPGDPTPDRNSRLGLGNRNNILNPDSVALSSDKAAGLPFGSPVIISGHFIGFYNDSTADGLTRRVDLYDPSNAFR